MEDRRIVVQKMEQSDIWALRGEYGQNPYCYGCSRGIEAGQIIVKVHMRLSRLPRIYHDRCFNRSMVKGK
jgi:hypothetical protein